MRCQGRAQGSLSVALSRAGGLALWLGCAHVGGSCAWAGAVQAGMAMSCPLFIQSPLYNEARAVCQALDGEMDNKQTNKLT